IGAGGDQLRRVAQRDAADRAKRHAEIVLEERKRRAHRLGLGGGGEYAAEGHVVGARGDRGFRGGEVGVARSAEDLARELGAGCRRLPSSLPGWVPFAPTATAMSTSSFTMNGTP